MDEQLTLLDALSAVVDPKRLHRSNDHDTSQEAAENASRQGPNQRVRVFRHLQLNGGRTDYEISQALGLLRSSVAKRRQELADLGYVTDSGQRRKTDTGVNAIVWRLSYTKGAELSRETDEAVAKHFTQGLKLILDAATKPETPAETIARLTAEIERLQTKLDEVQI